MTTIRRHHAGGGPARVVVAGAGFGGLAAARALARTGARVTLIDRNLYATFQPLLYQVATAGLAASDVAYPARAAARRYHATFRHGDLAGLDPAARQVLLTDGTKLGYDYLILATGVAAAYHGIPGAAEHALGLYTRTDAIILRDRLMTALDQISRAGGRRDVAVTIIGGGPTGVELAGTLADLRQTTLPALFGDIDPARVHITLLDRGPAPLATFYPTLQEYTRRQLAARGVQVRSGTAIARIAQGRVALADGTALPSDITVWAAGVAAPGAVSRWGLPQAADGRILTGPDLRAAGQDRIFAVGDIAHTGDQPLPQLAQPALQMGRHAADQIRRLLRGQATVPFAYRDKGFMATIGYRSAVVQLPHRLRIRGTAAWLAWLALHLVTLLGGRNRISALVNLTWRYLTWRHGGGLIVGDDPPATPSPLNRPVGRPATGAASTDPADGRPEPEPRRSSARQQHQRRAS